MSSDFSEVPVIDLAAEQTDAELADELLQICHKVGFFIVTNHGIAPEFMGELFESMRCFFALPEDQKMLIDKAISPHFRGYEAVGTELTNNRPDMREQIDLWTEWPPRRGDVEPAYLRLLGPNQWMPDELVPGQRDLVLSWCQQLGALADRLLSLIAVGLGLDSEHFRHYFGDETMSLTKLISYPPTPPGHAGVNAHHDTGFLTVLAAGATPGLQIQNHAGDWIDVPIISDTFVINLGEMLQAMTGNYLVATPHRVITNRARLSAGYFHGPRLDAPLEPLVLDPKFAAIVAASPHHSTAGFMAGSEETSAGVDDMQGELVANTYGQQLWNYFGRSYPENMARHHKLTSGSERS